MLEPSTWQLNSESLFMVLNLLPDTGSSVASLFQIDSVSGQIQTTGTFERDGAGGKEYFDLVVRAADNGVTGGVM